MYEEFFGLSRTPFSMSADPRFLYLTPQHREAATGLIYAVLNRKGMMALTGDAGTGKTTVLKAALASVCAGCVKTACVTVPTLTTGEFLEFVLLQFGLLSLARANKAERLLMFERFLLSAHEKNKTVLLIVDEAHKMSRDMLEEVRLLTNFETRQGKLLQIVLAGQSELDDILRQDDMCQLKQRIAYRFSLKGLSQTEVQGYIAHRWSRAGGTTAPPFDEEAIRGIALYSQGIPRLINAICDNALMMAFADGVRAIRGASVLEAARDLDLLDSDHAAPADSEENGHDNLNGLGLLASVSAAADGTLVRTLERQDAAPKESRLSRSIRKLLAPRQPESSHEQNL